MRLATRHLGGCPDTKRQQNGDATGGAGAVTVMRCVRVVPAGPVLVVLWDWLVETPLGNLCATCVGGLQNAIH